MECKHLKREFVCSHICVKLEIPGISASTPPTIYLSGPARARQTYRGQLLLSPSPLKEKTLSPVEKFTLTPLTPFLYERGF